MSDIVERLRRWIKYENCGPQGPMADAVGSNDSNTNLTVQYCTFNGGNLPNFREAAAELDRLRAEVGRLSDWIDIPAKCQECWEWEQKHHRQQDELDRLRAENERLRTTASADSAADPE